MPNKQHLQEEEFTGRLNFHAWRQIISAIWGHRGWLLTFLGSALLLALLDAALPWTMGQVFDALGDAEEFGTVLGWIGIYALLTCLLALFIFILITAAGHVSTTVSFQIREQGFARLQELPVAYHDQRSVGWLVSRLTTDCEKVANTSLWFSCDLIWGGATILFSAIVMLIIRWQVALIVLSMVPLLAIITRYFQVRLLKASRDLSRNGSIVTARHTENINGVRTTKALAREPENLVDFESVNHALRTSAIRHGVLSAAFMPIVWGIGGLGVTAALYFGGLDAIQGDLTLGQWVAFMSYATLTIFPIIEVSRRIAELQRAQAAAERIASLLDTQPQIRDTPEVLQRIHEAASRGEPATSDGLENSIDSLEFHDVTFSYVQGHPVLVQCLEGKGDVRRDLGQEARVRVGL